MRILGIDPGLDATGYGLIESDDLKLRLIEAGIIRTSHKVAIEIRLRKIHINLIQLIDDHKPEVLVLEKLYSHYKHPVTAMLMGHARGIICLAAGSSNTKLVSYHATRIKKAVVGKGHASKDQVARVVKDLLRLKSIPQPNDITDALACAIGYAYIERI